MATYSKTLLSGSTSGKGIKITTTATAGDTIHTAVSGSTSFDEIYVWLVNSDTVDRKVTFEYGGVTSPDNLIEMTVPAESGLFLAIPGLLLNGALVLKAFCATANVVMAYGYVNRITA